MKIYSQICTSREQSRRLLELGLKPETADMSSDGWNDPVVSWGMEWSKEIIESGRLPAWSLHRLWQLLPKSIWHDNGLEKKYHPIIEYGFVNYVAECGMELFDFDCGYEVWGSMIVVIEWLIKEGYFNNEYLV